MLSLNASAGVGAGLVVVADEVHLGDAVGAVGTVGVVAGGAATPVVDDVVAEVEHEAFGVFGSVVVVARAGQSRAVMGEEIVVEGIAVAPAASNERAVAMGTFVVFGFVQTFGDDAPLYGDIAELATRGGRKRLIDCPTGRAVVDDDVLTGADGNCVGLTFGVVPGAAPQMADDDMVCCDSEPSIFEADTASGSGLSSDCDIGFLDRERRLQCDGAGDAKDNRPGAVGFYRRAKATWSRVIEVRHKQHRAASSTRDSGAETLGAGKGRCGERGDIVRQANAQQEQEQGCRSFCLSHNVPSILLS